MINPINLNEYITNEIHNLKPPVANKLIYSGAQLKVMIVGGPNARDDFHYEAGEELFIQLKGNMQLDIMNNLKRKKIEINQSHIFTLPSYVPHSPQRFANTVGLVIERTRLQTELDSLQYYSPITNKLIHEDTFYCEDLGTQLKPIIENFTRSDVYREHFINLTSSERPPVESITESDWNDSTSNKPSTNRYPLPFSLDEYLNTLQTGTAHHSHINTLFNNEFKVDIIHGSCINISLPSLIHGDIFLWQLRKSSSVSILGQPTTTTTAPTTTATTTSSSSLAVEQNINVSPISIVLGEGDIYLLPAVTISSDNTPLRQQQQQRQQMLYAYVSQSDEGACLLVVTNKVYANFITE